MDAEPGDIMFANLPTVFRRRDERGDLARLLIALEELFFTSGNLEPPRFDGLERRIAAIPALFQPIEAFGVDGRETPESFLPWLASWLCFTPHTLFPSEALRRILAEIIALYGSRGTRDYLKRLLDLCFAEEPARFEIDDRPRTGFMVGESTVGVDTLLAESRPFWFIVTVVQREPRSVWSGSEHRAFEHRLRAVIDFAKPAHTAYELRWRTPARDAHDGDRQPNKQETDGWP